MIFIIVTLILGLITFFGWKTSTKPIEGRREQDQIPPIIIKVWRGVATTILVLWILWSCFLVVPVGSVSVATLFGTVREQTYDQGPHLVNPLYSFHNMTVQRKIVEFQSGQKSDDGKNADDVVAVSNDNLPLTIDVTYAFALNPTYASWLYRNIGDEQTIWDQLVVQAARAATRSATARFDYTQATTTERDLLAKAMEDDFRMRLVRDMVKMGLPQADAEKAFTILPVQLRKVLPPEKVLNSIAEKASSEQDLQRQTILTNIARQEAERRGQEGAGVKKLFDQLPQGFSSDQIAQVMTALANKERADAMLKAVETGKVTVMVMDGSPVSVSTTGK